MKDKKQLWQESLKPVVVLTVICLITSLLLALTNSFTAPVIEEQKREAANAARRELLPDADDFEQVTCEAEGVTEYYRATNGTGVVISAAGKGGYGGDVPVMVSFDAAGNILSVKVDAGGETAGKGDKVEKPDFTDQFKGREPKPMKLGEDIAGVAGSTVTSGAALKGVNCAVAAYNQVEKGIVTEEKVLTPEEMAALAAPDSGTLTLKTDAVLTVAESGKKDSKTTAVYTAENGDLVIVAEAAGYEKQPVVVYAAFDGNGAVTGLYVDASKQTDGLGTKAAEPDFTKQLIGKKPPLQLGSDVEAVAGATFSSTGVVNAVNEAAACYAANVSAGGEG